MSAAGIKFSIEDLEVGRFAHVAWVHSAMLDFRAVSDERSELYNRVGDAFVAIHLWSPDSPVGQRVVMPFIQQFEPMLLGNTSSSGSGRAAFDPRYQSQEEAEVDQMLGLGKELEAESGASHGAAADDSQAQAQSQSQTQSQPQSQTQLHTQIQTQSHVKPEEQATHVLRNQTVPRRSTGRRPHRRVGESDVRGGVGSN